MSLLHGIIMEDHHSLVTHVHKTPQLSVSKAIIPLKLVKVVFVHSSMLLLKSAVAKIILQQNSWKIILIHSMNLHFQFVMIRINQ